MASPPPPTIADLYLAAIRTGPRLTQPRADLDPAATSAALALGPLVAGALAEWVAAPLVTSYVVVGVVMAAPGVGPALAGDGGRQAAEDPRGVPLSRCAPTTARPSDRRAVIGFFA